MSFYETATFNEVKKNDVENIRKVLNENKDKLNYDKDYAGWCIGSEYVVDYLYENGETVINPKELEGDVDEIIENEFGMGGFYE